VDGSASVRNGMVFGELGWIDGMGAKAYALAGACRTALQESKDRIGIGEKKKRKEKKG
jgi:hypothetical protein